MKFKAQYKMIKPKPGGIKGAWWEEYDRENITNLKEAKEWAKAAVEYFNKTLRPDESPRKLLKVEMCK